jgi:putative ABC transport system permease protein
VAGLVFAAFGSLGLLACIGIYGIVAYGVSQRTRLALGARTRDVLRMVLREGAIVVGIGLAIGIGGPVGVSRLLAGFLNGVSATDLETFAGVTLVLLGVAWLACYLPARRAALVDPVVALKAE